MIRVVVLAWLIAGLAPIGALAPALHADQLLDRVLAIVGAQVITLSDVRTAQAFGLTDGAWAEASGKADGASPGRPGELDAPARLVLQQLIDRNLMLQEVEHYSPPEPEPAAIERRLAAIRARFPNEAAYRRALTVNGIDDTRLRSIVRDNLRLDSYLEQRFPAPPPPSEAEVIEYYQTHPDEFAVNGSPQAFNQVRDRIVASLTAARRTTLIGDWLAGLRSRADLTIVQDVQDPAS